MLAVLLTVLGLAAVPDAAMAGGGTIFFSSGTYDEYQPDFTPLDLSAVEPAIESPRKITVKAPFVAPTACTSRGVTRVAYMHYGDGSIQVVRADTVDGSKPERLTRGSGERYDPAFSPSCRRVAFERNGEIWAVGVRGGEETRLVARSDNLGGKRGYFSEPSYSPDGRRLIFTAGLFRPGNRFATGIYTAPVAGGPVKRIVNGPSSDARYSPDGRMLVFERDGEIAVARADGSHERLLTDDEFPERDPVFSPSGDRIAYAHYTEFVALGEDEVPATTPSAPRLRIIDLEGSVIRTGEETATNPSWIAGAPPAYPGGITDADIRYAEAQTRKRAHEACDGEYVENGADCWDWRANCKRSGERIRCNAFTYFFDHPSIGAGPATCKALYVWSGGQGEDPPILLRSTEYTCQEGFGRALAGP